MLYERLATMATAFLFCSTKTLMLLSAMLAAAYAVEFLVQPRNETVAPNSCAHFSCVVRGEVRIDVQWKVGNMEPFTKDMSIPDGYNASWETAEESSVINTSLYINTQERSVINGTRVQCVAAYATNHWKSNAAHLNIAASPMKPDGLDVNYDSVDTTVWLHWKTPFTHLPKFPILSYTADVEYFSLNRSSVKTKSIQIGGTETDYSIMLDESDICIIKEVCVSLRARNGIGYSSTTSRFCVMIDREHELFPVNASLSMQNDGRTLVSVVYQVPPCFPQGMQATVLVEEATSQLPNITTHPFIGGDSVLMESHTLAPMKQDVVYAVTVQLTSSNSESASSMPAYVVLPAPAVGQDNGSDSGGDNMQMVIIAVIVGALLLAVLIITALATSVGVLIWIRKRRKDQSAANHMQPNPLYENTYYDTIPELNLPLPRTRSPSYESHIYQDMPELIRRLQVSNGQPPSMAPPHMTSCGSLEELKRVQCTVVQVDEGVMERESEYVTMQSVTESTSPLQTDV